MLHAVAALRAQRPSLDAELHVAGAGPSFRACARWPRAWVCGRVTFHGAVGDMKTFYDGIDCLLHTPITEAFGLVAIEAAARGCPVVAARVDGLAEAVADWSQRSHASRRAAAVALRRARRRLEGLPQCVYDPATDALVEPRAVDPERLAAKSPPCFADARGFEALSAGASAHVLAQPSFTAHVRDVLAVIDGYARRS